MKLSKDLMRFFIIPVVLIAGIILTVIFTVFYTTTVRTPGGEIINSNWPKEFTLDFSQYIDLKDGTPTISETGKRLLKKNSLWIQILNDAGRDVCNYDKPSTVSDTYQPYELLNLYQYGTDQYSVFVNNVDTRNTSYSYLIGFPLSISKVVMYVDTDRYNSGKTLIVATAILTVLLILVLTIFYNLVIIKNYERIRASLGTIASRSYKADPNQRFLREIYEGLDALNHDIALADQQREKDTKAREEWLANITHDLKTPLAPIRGYAELMSESNTDMPSEQHPTLVVSDNTYQHYRSQVSADEIDTFYGFQFNDDLKSGRTVDAINQFIPARFHNSGLPGNMSYIEIYKANFQLFGSYVFIGFFLGVLFLLASGSVMYYKLIMEAQEEAPRYEILQKTGMKKGEVLSSVAKQLGLIYGIPLFIGLIHTVFGLLTYNRMLGSMGQETPTLQNALMAVILFVVLYSVFYVLSVMSYQSIVWKRVSGSTN